MASNRRSRTDCETYTDIERDPDNALPVAQKPVLPLIESADPHALFSWARNVSISLEEWFDIVNSVIGDTTINENPFDLYSCYCLVVCGESRQQLCDAVEQYFSLQANVTNVRYFSRNWLADVSGGDPLGARFIDGTYHPGAATVDYESPWIYTVSDNLESHLTDTDPVDVCNPVGNTPVLFWQGTGGSSTYLNSGNFINNTNVGMGDAVVMGAMVRVPLAATGYRTLFSMEMNNPAGEPDPPSHINYEINYAPDVGTVRYQKGDDTDNDNFVSCAVSDPELISAGGEFKHIRVYVTRSSSSVTLRVWCGGVDCGTNTVTTVVSAAQTLEDWSGHEVDRNGPDTIERNISFGHGVGPRLGWNDIMIWTYWGGAALLPEIGDIDYAFEENIVTFVDAEGFNPQVGDVLVVREILEDGTAVWCNEPKFANPGNDGDILWQGPEGPEDVYFAPPPYGLPLGGSDGQVLRKDGATDGDAVWSNETRYVTTWFGATDPSLDNTVVAGDFWVDE